MSFGETVLNHQIKCIFQKTYNAVNNAESTIAYAAALLITH